MTTDEEITELWIKALDIQGKIDHNPHKAAIRLYRMAHYKGFVEGVRETDEEAQKIIAEAYSDKRQYEELFKGNCRFETYNGTQMLQCSTDTKTLKEHIDEARASARRCSIDGCDKTADTVWCVDCWEKQTRLRDETIRSEERRRYESEIYKGEKNFSNRRIFTPREYEDAKAEAYAKGIADGSREYENGIKKGQAKLIEDLYYSVEHGTTRAIIEGFCVDNKIPCPGICNHCEMPISVRNPSGKCDHLYYPTYCKVCKQAAESRPIR